jgi:hypothetical protein
MAIRVSWDTDDRTAVREEFDFDWNWDEFYTALLEVARLMGEVEGPVDLIVDLSFSRPLNSSAAYYTQRWIDAWPHNVGHVAVITRQPMVAAVVSLVTRSVTAAGECQRGGDPGRSAGRAAGPARPED